MPHVTLALNIPELLQPVSTISFNNTGLPLLLFPPEYDSILSTLNKYFPALKFYISILTSALVQQQAVLLSSENNGKKAALPFSSNLAIAICFLQRRKEFEYHIIIYC